MKVVILLTLAALAASAPADKRFIVGTLQDLIHSINAINWHPTTISVPFQHLWDTAKAEFETIVHGINFDAVVAKLVPLTDSGNTERQGCQLACVSGAGAIGLGVAAALVEPACNPLCPAAMALVLFEEARQEK